MNLARQWRPRRFAGAPRPGCARRQNMFLRLNTRKKDGKLHRSWSVVENRRLRAAHTAQRAVL